LKLGVSEQEDFIDVFGELPKACLAFTQLLFGPLALGDVTHIDVRFLSRPGTAAVVDDHDALVVLHALSFVLIIIYETDSSLSK
jgi:hypothetical protein